MRKISLFIIRHAKSIHNLANESRQIFAGARTNSDLTPEGISEAKLLARKLLQKGKFDVIVSSQLKRSRRTAEIISKVLKTSTISLAEINEIDVGDFTRRSEKEVKKLYPQEALSFYSGDIKNWRFPGGEDYQMVSKRIDRFIKKIKELNKRRIIMIGHGMFNRVLLYKYFPKKQDLWNPREYSHDQILEAEV